MAETIKFKRFNEKEGNKFLAYIKANPLFYAQWEYKRNCFWIWSKGLLVKQIGDELCRPKN